MKISRITIAGRDVIHIQTRDHRFITRVGKDIIYVKFMLDNDCSDYVYSGVGTNYWISLYVGPARKFFTYKDGDITGSHINPMLELRIIISIIEWFKDNIMEGWDLLELSGSNARLDILYHNLMPRYGFRNVDEYMLVEDVLVYLKPPLYSCTYDAWDWFMSYNGCNRRAFIPSNTDDDRYSINHSRLWWYWNDIKNTCKETCRKLFVKLFKHFKY